MSGFLQQNHWYNPKPGFMDVAIAPGEVLCSGCALSALRVSPSSLVYLRACVASDARLKCLLKDPADDDFEILARVTVSCNANQTHCACFVVFCMDRCAMMADYSRFTDLSN